MTKQKQAKPISDELMDTLLTQGHTTDDINGLLKQFTKALLERVMQCELTAHLGYGKHNPSGNNSGNSRNGVTRKTLTGEFGEIGINVEGQKRSIGTVEFSQRRS